VKNHAIAVVANLSDREFRDYVGANLHPNDGDEAWPVLLSAELIERTFETLKDMRDQASRTLNQRAAERDEYQLECLRRGPAGRQDWVTYRVEYDIWRRKIANFNRMVLARLSETSNAKKKLNSQMAAVAKRDRVAAHAQQMTEERDYLRGVVRDLAKAVHQHQAATAVSGRDAEQHDYDLWHALDTLTVPMGKEREPAKIRNVLRTHWFDTMHSPSGEAGRKHTERLMQQAPAGRSPSFEGIPKARFVEGRKPLA
jgi:hypothetical protein